MSFLYLSLDRFYFVLAPMDFADWLSMFGLVFTQETAK